MGFFERRSESRHLAARRSGAMRLAYGKVLAALGRCDSVAVQAAAQEWLTAFESSPGYPKRVEYDSNAVFVLGLMGCGLPQRSE